MSLARELKGNFNSRCREQGRFFRQKRLDAAISQETIADYLGITVREVVLFESGKKSIPLHFAFALSNCLNIPPEELLSLFHELK